MQLTMKTIHYLMLLSIIVSLFNAYLYLNCNLPVCQSGDGPSYTDIIEVVLGKRTIDELSFWGRIKTVRFAFGLSALPIVLLISNYKISFLIFNFILYIATVYLMYKFFSNYSREIALTSSLMYIFSFVIPYRGIEMVPDLFSWFLQILFIYLLFRLNKHHLTNSIYFLAFLSYVFINVRETLVSTFFILVMYIFLVDKESIAKKLLRIFLCGIIFIVPLMITQLILYFIFNNTLINLYTAQFDLGLPSFVKGLFGYIVVFIFTFHISLIPLVFIRNLKTKLMFPIFLIIVANLPFIILAPLHSTRSVFILFPAVFALSGIGLRNFVNKFSKKYKTTLYLFSFGSYIVINFLIYKTIIILGGTREIVYLLKSLI